ncbi:MAG: Fur family transcriptional regulator [Halanaerobiaceae bacterium]
MKKTKKRMTKQRKKIMEVLKNTDSHPTADEIYDKVKEDIPNISLGTVYRNLNVLAEMGEIMILDYGSSYSRFDGNPKNHYHFKCENCGQVFDVDLDILDNLNQKLNSSTQFEVSHHRLEFYGLCPDCKNNKNNN